MFGLEPGFPLCVIQSLYECSKNSLSTIQNSLKADFILAGQVRMRKMAMHTRTQDGRLTYPAVVRRVACAHPRKLTWQSCSAVPNGNTGGSVAPCDTVSATERTKLTLGLK